MFQLRHIPKILTLLYLLSISSIASAQVEIVPRLPEEIVAGDTVNESIPNTYHLVPNSSSLTPLNLNLTIIPLSSTHLNILTLQSYLNEIFRQAGISWQVNMGKAMEVEYDSDGDGALLCDKKLLSSYSKEMDAIIQAYEANNPKPASDMRVMFLLPRSSCGFEGYFPVLKTYGFLFLEGGSDKNQVIAHELGHSLGLFHTFSEYSPYIVPQGSTNNLMDLTTTPQPASELWKWQWDELHNPTERMFAGLMDEGEGAAVFEISTKDGKDLIIDLPEYEKKYCFYSLSGIPIWLRNTEKIFFDESVSVTGFITGGKKYSGIIDAGTSTYFSCYYEHEDFLRIRKQKQEKNLGSAVYISDLDNNKKYQSYQLAKIGDPVLKLTDYSRFGVECIKFETWKLQSVGLNKTTISGTVIDSELGYERTVLSQKGACDVLEVAAKNNITEGIGRDFFILFYEGCGEDKNKINDLKNFCLELNQMEVDNCKTAKHQITESFAKHLQDKSIRSLESFLSQYYIGFALGAFTISEVDLWQYLADDYNSVTHHEYSLSELKVRYKILSEGGTAAISILQSETEGKSIPLNLEAFKSRYGDAGILVAFVLFFQLEADLLNIEAATNVVNKASKFFNKTSTKPFTKASMADKKFARDAALKRMKAGEVKLNSSYDDLMKHPLRLAYENEVIQLKKIGEEMIQEGFKSKEQIARELHQLRRELGIKYKDATPSDLREYIYKMNLADYGDELGPSIDYLRIIKKKSWDDIIDSASRPGGRFSRQYLLDRFPGEHNKLVPILDKYSIK